MAMDLITSPTAAGAPATVVTPTRTPDSDTETPPTNSDLNHHGHAHHRHAPPEDALVVVVVSYKECLKNHAASSGGHALDGCCEFMPGPTANPSDPTSLKCAACGCHRNFHRRDPDDPVPLHQHLPARQGHSPQSASQLLLSLGGQSPSGPSDHEIDPRVLGYFINGQNGGRQRRKKRFRTKFSQEQKEKMQEFAERIGWRLRRGEERLVEDFCKNVGVGRGVFKVWMHNNKNNSSSRREKEEEQQQQQHDRHLHHHNHNNHSNGGSNNGNCGGAVVYHEFYANGNGAQEAQ